MMQLPPQLQVLSMGLVADCLAQGFIFDEDQAKVHELLFEAMSMIMRLYVMLFFLEPTKIENMVTLFHQQEAGSIPPLGTATLALNEGVMFDAPEVQQAILQTKPTAVLWMSVSIAEDQQSYVVSYKALTSSIIANVDITFGTNDIDLKTVVEPRYPGYDVFHYVPLTPLINLDEYLDEDGEDGDDDGDDEDGGYSGADADIAADDHEIADAATDQDASEVAELPEEQPESGDDEEPPFVPDESPATADSKD